MSGQPVCLKFRTGDDGRCARCRHHVLAHTRGGQVSAPTSLWDHPALPVLREFLFRAYSDHDGCGEGCQHRVDDLDDAERMAHAALLTLQDDGWALRAGPDAGAVGS